MRLVAWGLTDVGRKREHNEDSFLISEDLGLFAVADGMGGHTGGDRASSMAVSILEREMRAVDFSSFGRVGAGSGLGPDGVDPPGQALERAARAAGRAIYDAANENPTLAGMGTTLTAMLVYRGRVYLAHVGDSRAYLYRDHRLEQLSVDHTWIEEQVRAGFMTAEEAHNSDLKHIVTRSVGYEREVRIDQLAMPTLMGDCFLLCSDGLSNYIDDRAMHAYFEQNYYSQLPKLLVDGANTLGGEDNITCVVVYVANDKRVPTTEPERRSVTGPFPRPVTGEFALDDTPVRSPVILRGGAASSEAMAEQRRLDAIAQAETAAIDARTAAAAIMNADTPVLGDPALAHASTMAADVDEVIGAAEGGLEAADTALAPEDVLDGSAPAPAKPPGPTKK